MTGMDTRKRQAVLLGIIGFILIVLGLKYMLPFLQAAGQQSEMSGEPVLLFFNVDEPCECMAEITQQAEQQMASWPVEQRDGILVMRIAMDQRKDLEAKYQVFRAPCLVLVDAKEQIVWRQDYTMIEGGPFKLEELEAVIADLGTN